jgi:hypothetical protein
VLLGRLRKRSRMGAEPSSFLEFWLWLVQNEKHFKKRYMPRDFLLLKRVR